MGEFSSVGISVFGKQNNAGFLVPRFFLNYRQLPLQASGPSQSQPVGFTDAEIESSYGSTKEK